MDENEEESSSFIGNEKSMDDGDLRGKRFNEWWRNNDPCETKIHQWEKWSGWEESGKISPT